MAHVGAIVLTTISCPRAGSSACSKRGKKKKRTCVRNELVTQIEHSNTLSFFNFLEKSVRQAERGSERGRWREN